MLAQLIRSSSWTCKGAHRGARGHTGDRGGWTALGGRATAEANVQNVARRSSMCAEAVCARSVAWAARGGCLDVSLLHAARRGVLEAGEGLAQLHANEVQLTVAHLRILVILAYHAHCASQVRTGTLREAAAVRRVRIVCATVASAAPSCAHPLTRRVGVRARGGAKGGPRAAGARRTLVAGRAEHALLARHRRLALRASTVGGHATRRRRREQQAVDAPALSRAHRRGLCGGGEL
eukprot:7321572-Prymnesium_polylepis.1